MTPLHSTNKPARLTGLLCAVIVALVAAFSGSAGADNGKRASAAGAWKGKDRYCDSWNFFKDPDCRASKYQVGPSAPVVAPTDVTGPTSELAAPPVGDSVWPAPPGGKYARLSANGRKAVLPRRAPRQVKLMVRAANSLTRKPYVWGGGHARWKDRGYDCSGAVSFVLRRAGYVGWPLVSGQLAHWGSNGPGRWVQVYAHGTHVFMVIAGLRFDTSPWGSGDRGPRWRTTVRPTWGFALRHPLRL